MYNQSNAHRTTHGDFDHFTAGQKAVVNAVIRKVVTYLQTNNDGITYGVENYLNTT